MADPRPPIPSAVKRAVRKNCYFGCIMCGKPVFDYDHVIPWNKVQRHDEDNLVLLCRQHHEDKTGGRLSLDRVLYRKENPFNKERSHTPGYLLEPSRVVDIRLAANAFSGPYGKNWDCSVLNINGEDFLSLHSEDGWLTFSAKLTDRKGNPVLVIDRGEVIVAVRSWDFQYEGSRLRIRSGSYHVDLDMQLANDRFVVTKGAFFVSGRDTGAVISKSGMKIRKSGALRGSHANLTIAGFPNSVVIADHDTTRLDRVYAIRF